MTERPRSSKTVRCIRCEPIISLAPPWGRGLCHCDAAFEDKDATRAIENLDEWKVIPATGHHFENGVCTVCDAKDADYVPPTGDENQLLSVATVLLTSMGVFAAVMFVEHKRRNS